MAEIFIHKDPITHLDITTTVVGVPPELGVTLSEAQAARDESAQAVIDSQAAQLASETASTDASTYRDEAFTYRNEAEVFRDQAQAVIAEDYVTSVSLQTTLDTGYYTQAEVNASQTGFVSQTDIDSSITTALTAYDTSVQVDAKLALIDVSNYVTNASLATSLADYDLSTEVDSKIAAIDLSPYATSASVAASLGNYDTSAEVDTKVAGATMAAGDILTALKTVDGDGSGLNADLLDGQNAGSFVSIGGEQLIIAKHRQRHGVYGDITLTNEGQNVFSPNTTLAPNGGTGFDPLASGLPNISYIGSTHTSVNGTWGEGFYFTGDGTTYGSITSNGIFHNTKIGSAFGDFTNLTADGVVNIAGADVQIGASTFTGDLNLIGNVIASGDITAFSDRRLKSDFRSLDNALSKIQALSGFNYYRDDLDHRQDGLIADEVHSVLPDSVKQGERYQGVNYNGVVALLVEAVKELKTRVEYLEARQ